MRRSAVRHLVLASLVLSWLAAAAAGHAETRVSVVATELLMWGAGSVVTIGALTLARRGRS